MKRLRAWFPRRLQASIFQRTCVITRATPGHLGESRELVRVGIDDFASKLVGKIDGIALPQRGGWIRQGRVPWASGWPTDKRHGDTLSSVFSKKRVGRSPTLFPCVLI
jgi:hypothetical protein